MKRIHKFPLPHKGFVQIPFPPDSMPLTVGFQFRHPYLWVEIAEPHPTHVTEYIFRVVWTGEEFDLPVGAKYIGTAQQGEDFVIHVYQMSPL